MRGDTPWLSQTFRSKACCSSSEGTRVSLAARTADRSWDGEEDKSIRKCGEDKFSKDE